MDPKIKALALLEGNLFGSWWDGGHLFEDPKLNGPRIPIVAVHNVPEWSDRQIRLKSSAHTRDVERPLAWQSHQVLNVIGTHENFFTHALFRGDLQIKLKPGHALLQVAS